MDGGDAAGGSQGLADLVDEYGGSLIADFERYYRPLPELLGSGGRSPRYILSLIKRLPVESCFVAEIRGGDQFRGWNPDRYLLTAIVDAVQANTHIVSKANGGKGKKPEPTYRPKKVQSKNGNAFVAAARSFYLAAQKKE